MSNEEFCKLDTEFYGEVVDNVKQIKYRSFTGEELKEYVEHCIKLKNHGVIGDVSESVIWTTDEVLNIIEENEHIDDLRMFFTEHGR